VKRVLLTGLVSLVGCSGTLKPEPAAPIASCFDGAQRTPAAGSPRVRRLSRYELEHTFEALFPGSGARIHSLLPADPVRDGYDSDAELLQANDLYVDAVRRAAEEVSAMAPVLPCGGAACADAYVQAFGSKAFRRALRPAEVQRYRAVFDVVAADDGATAGAHAVVEAVLQSPSFLYRTELGDTSGALTNEELASSLSYALWAAPPDEALLQASLKDPAVRTAQVRRLLADPKSRAALDHFASQWLELERLDSAVRDPARFPIDSPALRVALRAETLDSFAGAVSTGASFSSLLTAVPAQVPAPLVPLYGAAWGPERMGLLGQGAILLAHSNSETASPVHRGKLVRTRFFCQSMPPPPPGVVAALPPFVAGQTNRERFSAHSSNASCAGCHRLMDPIGLGFERFDAMGRTVEADAHGEVLGSSSSDGTFDGVPELAQRLAADETVQACFLSHWSRHVLGLTQDQASCGVDGVLPSLTATPGSLAALLEVPLSAPFFSQRGEGSPDAIDPPIPDAGVPVNPTGVVVTVRVDSQWATGACRTVLVDNPTAQSQTWTVEQPKQGQMVSHWSSVLDESGATWRFTGENYNATLAPMSGTSFGYCVSLP
jgi:Protein of unknown function (DUF1588)/Protein of unknown function (DUF1592)/Protein of unknown function (DUF1595)/Cellulose binding domain/Protein of unknown function (DUF1587)